MILSNFHIDPSWSLFLDRDGVINKRIVGDYIKKWEEFEFLPGVLEALGHLTGIFGKLFIVTNQQGIGKGVMTESQLDSIHDLMLTEIRHHRGKINKIYYSPYREEEHSVFRKPNTGLARKAKIDFPEIDLEKSIMAGDTLSDMQFGKNAGMITVLISTDNELIKNNPDMIDFAFHDLLSFTHSIDH